MAQHNLTRPPTLLVNNSTSRIASIWSQPRAKPGGRAKLMTHQTWVAIHNPRKPQARALTLQCAALLHHILSIFPPSFSNSGKRSSGGKWAGTGGPPSCHSATCLCRPYGWTGPYIEGTILCLCKWLGNDGKHIQTAGCMICKMPCMQCNYLYLYLHPPFF